MLGDERLPLRGAPGDAADDAPVLAERHLEVALLDAARTVDDLDAARPEDRAGVSGAERRQHRQLGGDLLVDRAEGQGAVDPEPRTQVVRLEAAVGVVVDAGAQLADPRRLDGQPRRLLVAAELHHHLGARLERAQHVERRNAAARPMRHVAVHRQHDRRPVKRIDQLRSNDSDDAAVPALAGHDDDRARADLEIGLDDLLRLGDDLRFFHLATHVFGVELLGQPARFLGHAFVGRQQQAGSDVGRAHAAGRVDAGREHEADVITVDLLAGKAADIEQGAQPDFVRPLRQHSEPQLGDDAILAGQWHDVGQRADGRDLDERRQPAGVPGPRTERLHDLERHADARKVLVGIGAVVALRVDDGERVGQRRVGLVMVGDDQIEA